MALTRIKSSSIAPGAVTTAALATEVSTSISAGSSKPTITSIEVTDSNYNVLDDTAVDVNGGYIKITGTGFTNVKY